jgi:uncharacterized protein YjiK
MAHGLDRETLLLHNNVLVRRISIKECFLIYPYLCRSIRIRKKMGKNISAIAFFIFAFINVISSDKGSLVLKGYNLSAPDRKIILPEVLNEISGVTKIDENTVACIQDEKGILYIFDLVNNKIQNEYTFYFDGDYEGITKVGNTIYVLRSDGTLFEITDYTSKSFSLKSYPTGIPANNNEGLCYDPLEGRLLIASKTSVAKGKEFKDERMVYGFDLKTKKMDTQPAFSFNISEIKNFAKENQLSIPSREKKKGTIIDPIIRFRTSAINIHPFSQKLYLLSAADHMLFIFDRKGKIEHIEQLNPVMFNKAEGLTFFPNGDMLITNEAQDKKPTLLYFRYLE